MSDAAGERRRALWLAAGIAAATAAVYAQVHDFEFVSYDDDLFVFENPVVAAGLRWEGIVWAFGGRVGNWVPLAWASHMLDSTLFGLHGGAHHLVSAALHVLNALLVFQVLRALTGATLRSGLVAGLFALHPLHVESVAWVSERRDVLSGSLWLLAMGAYAGYVRRRGARRYLLVAVLLALGLMAKPMGMTLPFVLLLLDFWPLRRLGPGRVRELVLEKVPLLALSLASLAVSVAVQRGAGAMSSLAHLPFMQRLENALVSCVRYLGKAVWPSELIFFYPYDPEPHPLWLPLACFVLLGAASAAAFRLRRRAPYLLFGWLWYLGTLLPVIGVVQVGSQSIADRYTYLPLLGVFVAVVWGASDLLDLASPASRGPSGIRRAAAAGAALWLVGLGLASRDQVGHWRNDAALFGHALSVDANHFQALYSWGSGLVREGRLEEAVELFERALAIQPRHAGAHNNLAVAYSKLGRLERALPHYRAAIELDPTHYGGRASYNQGRAFQEQGEWERARASYERAIAFDPRYEPARRSLSQLLARSGELEAARVQAREAVRIEPWNAAGHGQLARVELLRGEPDEARRHARRALALDPRNAVARALLEELSAR